MPFEAPIPQQPPAEDARKKLEETRRLGRINAQKTRNSTNPNWSAYQDKKRRGDLKPGADQNIH